MAAADQSAARVDDDVTAVVAPAGGDERPGLPLGAEAQLLVGDQLGDGEAVVDLGDVDVPGADAGRLVRRRRRALHGRPVRVVLVQRGQLEAVEGLTAARIHTGVSVSARARSSLATITAAAPSVIGEHMNRRSGLAIMREPSTWSRVAPLLK